MREIRTSGSMSGDGKRSGVFFCRLRAHPRLYRNFTRGLSGHGFNRALTALYRRFVNNARYGTTAS